MRFTQFGHQVPRRNSTMVGPRCNNSESEKVPERFAALSVKAGALSPSLRVSVVLLSANQSFLSCLLRSVPQKYGRSKQAHWNSSVLSTRDSRFVYNFRFATAK